MSNTRPNPIYLTGKCNNLTYGCSVDSDHLGSSHGSKKSAGMRGPFFYELGFTLAAKHPGDYCCLFVIEPRDCTVVGTIPVSKLEDKSLQPNSFDFDFYEDGYIEKCIEAFEQSVMFQNAVELATPVEGAFQTMRMEYEKMLKSVCKLDDKATRAFTKTIGAESFDTETMQKTLKNMYADIIKNGVMSVDELKDLGGRTPHYLSMFKFINDTKPTTTTGENIL